VATVVPPNAEPALAPPVAVAPSPDLVSPAPHWRPATLVAFRFCFVYLGLYVVTTQMLQGMLAILPGFPDLGRLFPMRTIILAVGRHLLGIEQPISLATTGSGDKLYDWLHVVSLLLIATIATVAWSFRARGRTEHARLYAWLRLGLRLAMATTFLTYGFAKLIPLQMPVLSLARLVEPFGNFSPMGVLWYSVGASPAYEMATGAAEVLAGLLLFIPATSIVGALVALGDATMIFLLNMTYDVPVKLFSFHLVLMALYLLAPNAGRLFDLLVRHRTGSLAPEPQATRSPAAWRRVVSAQAIYAAVLIGVNLVNGQRAWRLYGGGAPRSPLYGIWEVDSMTVGGVVRAALVSDSTRWRRIIFQTPFDATFQRMNDDFRRFTAKLDTTAHEMTLTTPGQSKPSATLAYRRVDREHLTVNGTFDDQPVSFALHFRDPDSFLQRSRGFHWVSEVPFNR